jgi:hypothetical protein
MAPAAPNPRQTPLRRPRPCCGSVRRRGGEVEADLVLDAGVGRASAKSLKVVTTRPIAAGADEPRGVRASYEEWVGI